MRVAPCSRVRGWYVPAQGKCRIGPKPCCSFQARRLTGGGLWPSAGESARGGVRPRGHRIHRSACICHQGSLT
jgi:hypothetical protein